MASVRQAAARGWQILVRHLRSPRDRVRCRRLAVVRWRSSVRVPLVTWWSLVALLFVRDANAARRVWIDTDPAIGAPWREVDDAFALVLAFRSPELRIVGISSTYGNASLARTTAVSRELVRRFGGRAKLRPADVYPGAGSRRDIGRRTDATERLARSLRDEKLTYLALGPLTNLAAFLHLHPELAGQIERVIFVGGHTSGRALAFGSAGKFRIHDANVCKDPGAVSAVLQSRIPLTLASVELAPEIALTRADLEGMRTGGPAGEFFYRRTRTWAWFWRSVVREGGALPFDVPSILPVIAPELLVTEARSARLEGGDDLVAESTGKSGGRAIRFCTAVHPRAKRLLLERVH